MKIGWLMPGGYAIVPPGDGRKVQALHQAEALERLGHEVVRLNPWNEAPADLDVLHVFEGAFGNTVGAPGRPPGTSFMSLAPIIDSNMPYSVYRLAAQVGSFSRNLRTNQGLHRMQALHSDLVIVRSRSERERVVRGLGVPPRKVAVVLLGVTPPAPIDPAEARRRLGLSDPFVLHVSGYAHPRKNVLRLIEAVSRTPYPLIVAGGGAPGAALDAIRALAAKNPRVRLMGFLDNATLQDLYAACKVFALPSIHEGAGLVALEAAAHGAALVVTERGGPPDYFSDQAEYVDPTSVASIRAALVRAWEKPCDGALKRRVRAELTWEASARALAAAFEAGLAARACA